MSVSLTALQARDESRDGGRGQQVAPRDDRQVEARHAFRQFGRADCPADRPSSASGRVKQPITSERATSPSVAASNIGERSRRFGDGSPCASNIPIITTLCGNCSAPTVTIPRHRAIPLTGAHAQAGVSNITTVNSVDSSGNCVKSRSSAGVVHRSDVEHAVAQLRERVGLVISSRCRLVRHRLAERRHRARLGASPARSTASCRPPRAPTSRLSPARRPSTVRRISPSSCLGARQQHMAAHGQLDAAHAAREQLRVERGFRARGSYA